MKLDRTKSYGTVYGHEAAQYEQNGLLFDAAGRLLGDGAQALGKAEASAAAASGAAKTAEAELALRRQAAARFLEQQLKAPADKAVLKQEADLANLDWDDVTRAFNELGGIVEKGRWRLPVRAS